MRLLTVLSLTLCSLCACGFPFDGGGGGGSGAATNDGGPPANLVCDESTLTVIAELDPNITLTAVSDGTIQLAPMFPAVGNTATGLELHASLAFSMLCSDLLDPPLSHCFRLVVNQIDPEGSPFVKSGPLLADLKFVGVNSSVGAVISASAVAAPAVDSAIAVVSDNATGGERVVDITTAVRQHVLAACEAPGVLPSDVITIVIALRFSFGPDGDATDDATAVYGIGTPSQFVARIERLEEGDI